MAIYHGGLPSQIYGAQQAARREPTKLEALLAPVWQAEETRKSTRYNNILSAITRRISDRFLKPKTPLQKKIAKWGYDGDFERDAAIAKAQHEMEVAKLQMSSNLVIGGNVIYSHGYNTLQSQTSLQNSIAQNVGITNNMVSVGSVPSSWPDYHSSIHYRLMRAVEDQVSSFESTFRYDDDACNMLDYRLYTNSVPICWVVSFSISNDCDPEMAATILQHYGYSLSEDEHDG